LPGVQASMNFMAQTLTVETGSDAEFRQALAEIEKIVHKHEPDVRVVPEANAADGIGETKAAADENPNQKKAILRLAAGGGLFAMGMLLDLPPGIELAVFLASYLIMGGTVVLRAIRGIARGQIFSEHFLMSVATIGAFLVGEYPEGAAVMLFYLVGEMFQDRAVDRSRRSISALLDIRPDFANLKSGASLTTVSPEAVRVGDLIVVKAGEKVPLDGTVTEGTSTVDTSAITGESLPREVQPGDQALSGFINRQGILTIQVTKPYAESTVARILELVQNAAGRKAPTENFISKFAAVYTPIVVFAALALAFLPPLLLAGASLSQWTYRALVFLVVSCPCALVISTPLGFFGGIGGASRRGILVKGGNFLEALNQAETVVFDKTGTLTQGRFTVTAIDPQPGFTEQDLLKLAAQAEGFSNHPIARSIVQAYDREPDLSPVEDHQELAGFGVTARIAGREVLAGGGRLMVQSGIPYRESSSLGTVVHLAVDRKYAGQITVSDEVKADAAAAIRELKELGVRQTVMLTGDSRAVGEEIGRQLGLDKVYAELLPEDKVTEVEALMTQKSPKEKIIFVGDGINDAPALARADIGIAMGGMGSDAAIEAADIVIMDDEPGKVALAIRIARRTRAIVMQNIFFALGVKAVFLVLGAFGIASMWEAVFADMGVALLAIFNAMRVMDTESI